MPWDGFDPSTSGAKSDTLPVAYKETAKFKAAQDLFQTNVAKLADATKAGNEAAVKAAIGDVGKACGACHNDFREKH